MKSVILSLITMLLLPAADAQTKKSANGYVTLSFSNEVNGKRIVLNDSSYTNSHGETYTMKKLKYYISNIRFYSGSNTVALSQQYWLINQAVDSSLSIKLSLPVNKYDSIAFLLGVDSAANTSGAQTGALDPLNDMFWTWHSGYIMEKLEGVSPQSNIVNNKFEYHLGGYEGRFSVLQSVYLSFPGNTPVSIEPSVTKNIFISMELNRFWDNAYPLKISETPVCALTGELAKKIAGNFAGLFHITTVTP